MLAKQTDIGEYFSHLCFSFNIWFDEEKKISPVCVSFSFSETELLSRTIVGNEGIRKEAAKWHHCMLCNGYILTVLHTIFYRH